MKRRTFIQNFSLLTGGFLTACQLKKEILNPDAGKKVKGKVTVNGVGIKDVVISDGYTVVATDEKGNYELTPHIAASSIFISTPSGYGFQHENNISRHYQQLNSIDRRKADFTLLPLSIDDIEHRFLIWADPQVKNESDIEKMMTETVPDVQKLVSAAGSGALLHGITVGDIVWDTHQYYPDYNKAVQKMGIPFFQCLGNHDMDYNKGGDESSDDTFQATYGPTYYSFNRGKAHYIVMDNVRYLGKDKEYDGFFQQNQLDWLQKDLSFVSKDKLIILCVHIPVHKGTKNNEDLYSLLEGRDVHIMSGHTHYHVNSIKENIYEHNHGTVCGAWWTGPICGDGTPCGYGVYQVKGNQLSWHYQSTGEAATHQMKIFADDFNASQKQVVVNIWNHDPSWKTEYLVDGQSKGALEQFEGFDPLAYKTLLGPSLPNPRGFAEPRKTNHLFKTLIPADAKEVKVIATDRFGKKFTEIYKV